MPAFISHISVLFQRSLYISLFSLIFVGSAYASNPTYEINGATERDHIHDLWYSSGGETVFYLNPDRLRDMGLVLSNIRQASKVLPGQPAQSYHELGFPALTTGVLEIQAPNGIIQRLLGGSLQHSGGFVLNSDQVTVDLRGFMVRPRSGQNFGLEVADRNGNVWFTMDHSHYQLRDGKTRLAMKHMNLRVQLTWQKCCITQNGAGSVSVEWI